MENLRIKNNDNVIKNADSQLRTEERPEKNCFVCGSAYKESRLKGLLECGGCHFVTANLDLSDEELRHIYSKEYFQGKEYWNYIADKKILQKNFGSRLSVLLRYAHNSNEKKLFEIGCAYGFFLEMAKDKFKSVGGIDISHDAVLHAKEVLKLDAAAEDFLKYNLKTKYDVFCMWDTFEHLKAPHLFIEKISQCMNKGGILALTTSDIGSFNARLRGKKWRQIHPPTHLHYASSKTLPLLLEKYGLETVHMSHPGMYVGLNQMFYIILSLRLKKPKLYDLFSRTGLLDFDIYLNMFDFLYVIARKK